MIPVSPGAPKPEEALSEEVAEIDELCDKSSDGTHCDHWWDDVAPCCACGDDTDAGQSDGSPRSPSQMTGVECNERRRSQLPQEAR